MKPILLIFFSVMGVGLMPDALQSHASGDGIPPVSSPCSLAVRPATSTAEFAVRPEWELEYMPGSTTQEEVRAQNITSSTFNSYY